MIHKDPAAVLDSSVLTLNRFYSAIHIVNVRRAFTLLYCGSAEVILVENGRYASYDFDSWRLLGDLQSTNCKLGVEISRDGDWIRVVSGDIRVPRIIRLTRYDGFYRHSLRFSRRSLFARDDHRCQYCGVRYSADQLSFDHVIPRSRGGTTSWENVVCSCLQCNSRKGGRTPQEATMRLIRRPSRPKSNPLLVQKLSNPRYHVWQTFLAEAAHCLDVG